jgi:ubiquinone/menaquinone biosynthesis C-methylase UbiE
VKFFYYGGGSSSLDNKTVPSKSGRDVERFNRWAPRYDQSVMQRLLFGPVHSKMLDLLITKGPKNPPRRIIDVGCGTGRLLRAASAYWPEAELLGVDPAGQMISEAQRLNPKAIFKVASSESLPFPDHTADIALSSVSFHHWSDQKKGLQEIARVLRPDGWFCLADITFLLAKWFERLGGKVRSRQQIRAQVLGAGLRVLQQQNLRMRFMLITLAQKS